MQLPREAILLRIFFGESNQVNHRPLHEAVVLRLGFEKVDSYQQRLTAPRASPPQAAMACSRRLPGPRRRMRMAQARQTRVS